jgi:hypothetical protein
MNPANHALTVDSVTRNLRAVRASATADHIREGRAWYPAMGRLIAEIAREATDATGDFVSKGFAVGVFAAYSQNATWSANVTMATNYLHGKGQGGMRTVMAEIDRMENGENPPDVLSNLKRPDFWRNLMGRHTYVTCDRWHLRAAFKVAGIGATDPLPKHIKRDKKSGALTVPLTPEVHDIVTEATRKVAAEFGETPAACQAVIWCAIRGDGK